MIFTFGAIAYLIGWLFVNILGAQWGNNWADYVGIVFCLLGIAGMLSSLLVLAWQYLP